MGSASARSCERYRYSSGDLSLHACVVPEVFLIGYVRLAAFLSEMKVAFIGIQGLQISVRFLSPQNPRATLSHGI